MSSKKRKYREKISDSSGGVLDLFDHPAFRSSLPAPEAVRVRDETTDDDEDADDDERSDAPAAEPRPA